MRIESTVSRSWPAYGGAPEIRINQGASEIPDGDEHAAHRAAAQRLVDVGLARIVDPNEPAPAASPKPADPPGSDHPPVEDTYATPPADRPAVAVDRTAGKDIQPSDVDAQGGKKLPLQPDMHAGDGDAQAAKRPSFQPKR